MQFFQDLDVARFGLELLKVIGACAVFFITYWLAFRRRRTSRLEDLEGQVSQTKTDLGKDIADLKNEVTGEISGLKNEVTRLDSEVKNLPSHEELGKLYTRINEVHGDVREIAGELGGIARGLDNISTHLLNSGK